MQTPDSMCQRGAHLRGIGILAISFVVALTLSSCAAPRTTVLSSTRTSSSTCAASTSAALDMSRKAQSAFSAIERILAGDTALDLWSSLAAECPDRIPQALMWSVHDRASLRTASAMLGLSRDVSPSIDISSLNAVDFDGDALSSMAVAEDRAGFALQLLAARGGQHATLEEGDQRRAIAARLTSSAKNDNGPDRRQQVYSVTSLIAHPDLIVDSATGLSVPTAAVVEMDCARAITAAITAAATARSSSSATTTQGSAQKTQGATQKATRLGNAESLTLLMALAQYHLWNAVQWGYPVVDSALLD